ncbi:hypothetical protein [uncultured Pseudokineococcus sp.]|uniref:hypothetical protein n=1 Tax=uncultured Pseudokineococcus sp. TaxID=1642928 RepID=UPI002631AEA8|nr:hypothetical protein [uncultured Pseudokineococcus sp.]
MAVVSRAARVLSVIAGALVVLGVAVVATAPPQSFGWFAYAPLASEAYDSPALPVVLGGRQLLGLAALVAGLVLAGVSLGLRLGRSRRP